MIDNTNNNTPSKGVVFKTQKSPENAEKSTLNNTQAFEAKESPKDKVNISYSSEPNPTYQYNMSLEQTAGDGLDLLRGLVLNIFKEQGLEYKIQTTGVEVDLETMTPVQAEELVAKDGYFGVEKTAERIFNFAVGIAGNDPSKIDAIREGINSGFQDAMKAFGGELPDISYDTFNAVINKLDEWAESSQSPKSSI
ncbi:MAG: hypothetical protein COA36_04300 [Desulfotalea sp.]|nr:MAG: hypothetical protein COA36_04300 [Desulfotalea sp.]